MGERVSSGDFVCTGRTRILNSVSDIGSEFKTWAMILLQNVPILVQNTPRFWPISAFFLFTIKNLRDTISSDTKHSLSEISQKPTPIWHIQNKCMDKKKSLYRFSFHYVDVNCGFMFNLFFRIKLNWRNKMVKNNHNYIIQGSHSRVH
jgi:hypothetical protein